MADFMITRNLTETRIEFDPPADPAIVNAALRMNATINRQIRRLCRESHLRIAPGWIDDDPPCFAFLGFGPRARPFDWRFDQADVPVEPRPPAPYPEQARLRLFLRPPAPAVGPPTDPGKSTRWGPGA